MENVLSLPGRGNTYFYFSQMGKDGFSKEQQAYIRDLIAAYRKRYSRLEITAVWDFGMEEGTRYENDKYGVFADCRDLAVSNRDMASISFNQVRVSRMPMDIPAQQLREILEDCCYVAEHNSRFRKIRDHADIIIKCFHVISSLSETLHSIFIIV